jgi:hypothetical protein
VSFANPLQNQMQCQTSSWFYNTKGSNNLSVAKFESPFDIMGNMPAFLIAPSEPQILTVQFRCQNGSKGTNSGMFLDIKVI